MHIDVDNDLLDLSNSGRPFNDLTAARVRNKRKYFIFLIVCILNWFEINFKFIYRYKCDDAYEGAILFDFCFSLNFVSFCEKSALNCHQFRWRISPYYHLLLLTIKFQSSRNCVCAFLQWKVFFKKKSSLKWHWWCTKYLFCIWFVEKKICCTLLFACWYC